MLGWPLSFPAKARSGERGLSVFAALSFVRSRADDYMGVQLRGFRREYAGVDRLRANLSYDLRRVVAHHQRRQPARPSAWRARWTWRYSPAARWSVDCARHS